MEAWALQYNQHLGKILLVPVEEPKSILDEIIKETMSKRPPNRPGENGGSPGATRPVKGNGVGILWHFSLPNPSLVNEICLS